MNGLKVALNVSQLSAPELMNRARLIVQQIDANVAVFATPNPATSLITAACDELETLIQEASDGSKLKITLRNDKQRKLTDLLAVLGAYVEQIAAGNEETIHLASMDVRRGRGAQSRPDFFIEQGEDAGSVSIQVKARNKAVYKWQYSSDAGVTWVSGGITDVCKTVIRNLVMGIYMFRVTFIDGEGEHEQLPVRFAVN